MTYEDNPELVEKVLRAELMRQQRILVSKREYIRKRQEEVAPILQEISEEITACEAALALIEGLEKTLGKVAPDDTDAFTGAVEEPDSEPAEEDPYDVAFAKTDTVEPSKTETFGRAPLMGEPGF